MKMFVVLAALVAAVAAAPAQDVVIVKQTPLDNIGIGGYNFGYELSNGETRQESAQLRDVGTENEALVITGSYSWVDPVTGQKYLITYVADENGFHPQGEHIPV